MMTIGQELGAAVKAGLAQLDGARTLIISPGPFVGWNENRITVTFEADVWRLPRHLDSLRDNWEREHLGEHSYPKIAIRHCHASPNGELRCTLAPTEWKEVRPWHIAGTDHSPIRTGESSFAVELPNIAVAHVIATTTDQKIILARRGMKVHYHPGSWAASYEEGLSPEDMAVPQGVFHAAAARGATEEILGQGIPLSPNSSHLLAFIAEVPLENPAAVMLIELPLLSSDLLKRVPLDEELMSGTVEFLLLDPDEIAMALCNQDPVLTRQWHPTARYRLIALMLHYFGQDATVRSLNRR